MGVLPLCGLHAREKTLPRCHQSARQADHGDEAELALQFSK